MRVEILSAQNPFNLDAFDLRLAGSTATEDLPEPSSFSLYPNPAGAELTLSMERVPRPSARAEIIDVAGRIVRRIDITGSTTRIDTSSLPSGLYAVRVLGPGGPEVRRTVVVF